MKRILSIALAIMLIGTMTVFAVGTEEVSQSLGRMANGFGFGGQGYAQECMVQNTELSTEEIIAIHKDRLQVFVDSGRLSQEDADARLEQMKENLADGVCDESERMLIQQKLEQKLQNGEGYGGNQGNRKGNSEEGLGNRGIAKGLQQNLRQCVVTE
jgi:hypothetical protein